MTSIYMRLEDAFTIKLASYFKKINFFTYVSNRAKVLFIFCVLDFLSALLKIYKKITPSYYSYIIQIIIYASM